MAAEERAGSLCRHGGQGPCSVSLDERRGALRSPFEPLEVNLRRHHHADHEPDRAKGEQALGQKRDQRSEVVRVVDGPNRGPRQPQADRAQSFTQLGLALQQQFAGTEDIPQRHECRENHDHLVPANERHKILQHDCEHLFLVQIRRAP